MDPWSGRLVRLRAVEPADVEVFVEAAERDPADAREYGEGYLDFPRSRASLERLYERSLEPDGPERGWSIVTRDGGVLVGGMATLGCDARVGSFEYGISIFAEHRRQGYATDAIAVLLAHFFREHRYQKVGVRVHEFNAAAIALHEQLGFRLEGRTRRVLFTHGRHWDQLWYGMTVEEFESTQPSG